MSPSSTSGPAVQNLVDGVMHLLHYKDDALVTESVLPQLIAMLNSSDPNLVTQAPGTVYFLCQKRSSETRVGFESGTLSSYGTSFTRLEL